MSPDAERQRAGAISRVEVAVSATWHHRLVASRDSYTQLSWHNVLNVGPRAYRCGYCGSEVGPNQGYYPTVPGGNASGAHRIFICSRCTQPTYFDGVGQYPGPPFGNEVGSLPEDVNGLYREARDAFTVGAYTAAVLTCRKILMNVAVAQGAAEGETFLTYVEHLADAGYVPPNGRGWVDHIRKRGNEANHEIELMAQGDAEELIAFVEMLLKFVYEFPARVPTAP